MIVAVVDTPRATALRSLAHATRRHLFMPAPATLADPAAFAELAPRLPGVDVHTNGAGAPVLRFDSARWTPELAEILAFNFAGGVLVASPEGADPAATDATTTLAQAPDGEPVVTLEEPTASDLDTIRKRHALDRNVKAEELFIFERWVCNDAPARSGFLQLDTSAITKAAADFERGRSVLLFHDTTRIVGRTFAGAVEKKTREGLSANWVRVRGYGHRRASMQDTIDDLRLGVLAYDSIGFSGGDVSYVEDTITTPGAKTAAKRSFLRVAHDAKSPTPFVAVETSFVYLGMLHGAGNARLAVPPQVAPNADGLSGDGNPADAPQGETPTFYVLS